VQACCPFHSERTPSFFIFNSENPNYKGWFFKCHGCGESGTLNRLLKRFGYHKQLDTHYKTPTRDARPVETPFKFDTSVGYPKYYDYFQSRGVSNIVVDLFGFRFDFAIPAAVLPVYTDFTYYGFIRRALDSSYPKYIIESGMDISHCLFGFDNCDPKNHTFVVEGIIDAACLWSQGKQAVAIIGTKFEPKINHLAKLEKITYIPDNDSSGLITAQKFIKTFPHANIKLLPARLKDISDAVVSGYQF